MTKIELKFWETLGEFLVNKTKEVLDNVEALLTTYRNKHLKKNPHKHSTRNNILYYQSTQLYLQPTTAISLVCFIALSEYRKKEKNVCY